MSPYVPALPIAGEAYELPEYVQQLIDRSSHTSPSPPSLVLSNRAQQAQDNEEVSNMKPDYDCSAESSCLPAPAPGGEGENPQSEASPPTDVSASEPSDDPAKRRVLPSAAPQAKERPQQWLELTATAPKPKALQVISPSVKEKPTPAPAEPVAAPVTPEAPRSTVTQFKKELASLKVEPSTTSAKPKSLEPPASEVQQKSAPKEPEPTTAPAKPKVLEPTATQLKEKPATRKVEPATTSAKSKPPPSPAPQVKERIEIPAISPAKPKAPQATPPQPRKTPAARQRSPEPESKRVLISEEAQSHWLTVTRYMLSFVYNPVKRLGTRLLDRLPFS
ncbi:MAG: hypothetical protein Q9169_004408 [Polycauliona sp. 2 TL-2023]